MYVLVYQPRLKITDCTPHPEEAGVPAQAGKETFFFHFPVICFSPFAFVRDIIILLPSRLSSSPRLILSLFLDFLLLVSSPLFFPPCPLHILAPRSFQTAWLIEHISGPVFRVLFLYLRVFFPLNARSGAATITSSPTRLRLATTSPRSHRPIVFNSHPLRIDTH